jgi:hypothetical protein
MDGATIREVAGAVRVSACLAPSQRSESAHPDGESCAVREPAARCASAPARVASSRPEAVPRAGGGDNGAVGWFGHARVPATPPAAGGASPLGERPRPRVSAARDGAAPGPWLLPPRGCG